MNIHSLSTKINVIFFIAFLLLAFHFIFFMKFDKKEKYGEMVHTHEKISYFLRQNRLSKDEITQRLKEENFTIIPNPHRILRDSDIIERRKGFETLRARGNSYLHIVRPRQRLLFQDNNEYKRKYFMLVLFASIFIFLIFMYWWLRKSLMPLTVLKNEISRFAQGDLDIHCRSDKKDEIAVVANEFDSAVKEIKLLLNSRQLFLRTVMHELKTPLAKGRIVSELIHDEKQKNRMTQIFKRLDELINDFSKIEQVVSKNLELQKAPYELHEIINHSFKLLMLENQLEEESVQLQKHHRLMVDFEMMSLVMKNLIDNALKYSTDSKVRIIEDDTGLSFISKGEALTKPLADYFKPFHNDTDSKNHGMGLGLYIVKSILDLHGFGFEYFHENESNHFKINYNQK